MSRYYGFGSHRVESGLNQLPLILPKSIHPFGATKIDSRRTTTAWFGFAYGDRHLKRFSFSSTNESVEKSLVPERFNIIIQGVASVECTYLDCDGLCRFVRRWSGFDTRTEDEVLLDEKLETVTISTITDRLLCVWV